MKLKEAMINLQKQKQANQKDKTVSDNLKCVLKEKKVRKKVT